MGQVSVFIFNDLTCVRSRTSNERGSTLDLNTYAYSVIKAGAKVVHHQSRKQLISVQSCSPSNMISHIFLTKTVPSFAPDDNVFPSCEKATCTI